MLDSMLKNQQNAQHTAAVRQALASWTAVSCYFILHICATFEGYCC